MTASPLVILYKQLGDVLLLEPALAALAATAGADVLLATRPEFTPLLSLMPRVRPAPGYRPRRASQVVSFDPKARACVQSLVTWAPAKRLIVNHARHLHGGHRLFFPTERRVAARSPEYRAEYFFTAVGGTSAMPFRPPRLVAPPRDWLPAGLPGAYVLVHATSAWRRKCWLPERWAQVLAELAGYGVGPFVVTGGGVEWERQHVQAIVRASALPLTDLCGRTQLREYLAVVANASAVLCVDGSCSHLAAAFGKPVLTLFGPSTPLHWHFPAPHSRVVDARRFCGEPSPPLLHIPVAAVVAAFLDLLADGRPTERAA